MDNQSKIRSKRIKNYYIDVVKANRKVSRDEELKNSYGWKSVDKIKKSKKEFKRSNKHKNNLE